MQLLQYKFKKVWLIFVFSKKTLTFALRNRGVEQLVARWAHNPKVIGSSPIPATKQKESLKSGSFCFISIY